MKSPDNGRGCRLAAARRGKTDLVRASGKRPVAEQPDGYLVPFSLLFGGFAVFWEMTSIQSNTPVLFRLWGVPFLLMSAYLVFGRFFVDAWVRSKTRYALTNERILIARDGPFRKFVALGLDRLPQVQLDEQAGGRGTIRFGEPAPTWGRTGWSGWTPALDQTPQFIAIDDARGVFDKIQRAARAAASPRHAR